MKKIKAVLLAIVIIVVGAVVYGAWSILPLQQTIQSDPVEKPASANTLHTSVPTIETTPPKTEKPVSTTTDHLYLVVDWKSVTQISMRTNIVLDGVKIRASFNRQRRVMRDGSEELFWTFNLYPVPQQKPHGGEVGLPNALRHLEGKRVSVNGVDGEELQFAWVPAHASDQNKFGVGYFNVQGMQAMFSFEDGSDLHREASR